MPKILIIEDDEKLRDELKIFLSLVPTKRFGYSVGMMYYYVQYLESLNQEW